MNTPTQPIPKSVIEVVCDIVSNEGDTFRVAWPIPVPTPLLEDEGKVNILLNVIKKSIKASPEVGDSYWYGVSKLTMPVNLTAQCFHPIKLVGYSDLAEINVGKQYRMIFTFVTSFVVKNRIMPMLEQKVSKEIWNDPKKRTTAVVQFLKSLKDRMDSLTLTANVPKRISTECYVMNCDKYVYFISKSGQRLMDLMTPEEFALLPTI